ncbi:MAG TPA: FkbM family methyltransferase [Solirubrobacter sp.]|nr:FkbM family methyltransferase [Solirubrobacter sp.]
MSRPRDPRAWLRRLRAQPAQPAEPAPPEPQPAPDWLLRDGLDSTNMRRLVSFLLRPGDNAVDVGSNHGALLAEMLRVAPQGHHVAFEPIPELAADLRARFPTAEVHEAAASNVTGTATFSHVRAADGWSGLKFRPLPTGADGDVVEIEVRLAPLDELLDPDVPRALIKIDVEGAEQQVIEGALETLKAQRPTVIFEHGLGSANVFGTTPDDIHGLLVGEIGYRIFDLDGNGPYPLDEFKRVFWAAERVNFVAHV